jgi:hypothetical protein
MMARLERASRFRWPRRIIVSMVSLRDRLAAAAKFAGLLKILPSNLE